MSITLTMIASMADQIEQLSCRLHWYVTNSDIPRETGIFANHAEQLLAISEDIKSHIRDLDDYGKEESQ